MDVKTITLLYEDICIDKQRVCMDKVDLKIVYRYVELILNNEIYNSGYPTNLQGYTTLKEKYNE